MKHRIKKAPLQEEIKRLEHEQKIKDRSQGLSPASTVSSYGKSGVLNQINKPKKVQLWITPELYRECVAVIEGNQTTLTQGDPLSAPFWYGLLADHHNALITLQQKKQDIKDLEEEAADIRQSYRLQND
jgi:hypothetical protein